MARPTKEGLDYFSLDVDIFEDEVIEGISGEFEIKGELAVIKLLCAVYKKGYFIVWNDLMQAKIAKQIQGSKGLVNQIVARLVEWNFFDRDLFNSAKVLTSVNIQNRYFEAIKRRKSPKPTLYVINVDINSTSSDVNADINTQSKVKESKVNQTKEPKTTETTKDIYTNAREEIFNKIETEFGRPLSPIELETIGIWIDEDHFSYEIVICALQEAVLNQVWNLKYMNTILQNWSKQHITNKQEYAAMKQQRANQKAPVEPVAAKKNLPKIPIYKISEQE